MAAAVTEFQATRKDHRNYCLNGDDADPTPWQGRSSLHFELPSRRPRTAHSSPIHRTSAYGPRMWEHILREQLQVSEDEFWACVGEKK